MLRRHCLVSLPIKQDIDDDIPTFVHRRWFNVQKDLAIASPPNVFNKSACKNGVLVLGVVFTEVWEIWVDYEFQPKKEPLI
ncbi:hypothetical protein RJ639_044435 [Escallonia herrerae]|uniref:Uncharacterized protein n=1 Tax=Escallonia herrerae TaxID=1293975 RepID=A0AA88WC33_9ASTE|nr:hypothetical protein RJ639_044435 [Escallonia herrerae]